MGRNTWRADTGHRGSVRANGASRSSGLGMVQTSDHCKLFFTRETQESEMNNLIKIMSARKEFGGVITFIVHPDFIRDGRFYPVIPKTIQMVINEAATRPEKLYFIDQNTSAPVKNTDSEMLVMDVSVFTVGRNLDNLVV